MVYCLHGIFSQIILLYIFSLNYLVVNRKNKLNCTTEETTDKSAIDKIRRIKFTRAHTHFIHFDIKDTKNLSFEQEVFAIYDAYPLTRFETLIICYITL